MSVECVVETGRERGFNAFDCGLIQVMDWMQNAFRYVR